MDAMKSKCRITLLAGIMMSVLIGCASTSTIPAETYNLKNLTIVFLDAPKLQEKYAAASGKPAVTYTQATSLTTTKTVKGFFDFATNTIYCQKMDFDVCGHELHHAVLGRFHFDH